MPSTDPNEVRSKEVCSQLDAWALNTTVYEFGAQPDGLDWESILRMEETGVTPQSLAEII